MTDQLEREKATRRGNRAVITKYSNEAKELLANGENIDENTKDRLNTLHVVFLTSGCRNVGAFRFFGDSSFHSNFKGILPSFTNILPFKDFFKSSGLK